MDLINFTISSANEGVWTYRYGTYFALTMSAMLIGLFVIHRYVKKEKTLNLILKITAMCLLVAVIANRICVCNYKVNICHDAEYSWWNLIPDSFCGITSFGLSLLVLFAKPTNALFNFFVYTGVAGPVATLAYPNFIDFQGFAEPASYTGLIHHSIALFLALTLLISKRFKPKMNKLYVYPIAHMVCLVVGLFEIQVLKFHDGFDIKYPLLDDSLPILTSWWMILIVETLGVALFITLYSRFVDHKSFKKIWLEFKSQFTGK